MPEQYSAAELTPLIKRLSALSHEALEVEDQFRSQLNQVAPRYRDSAANLLHYLAVRRHDLRQLQTQLHALGLSSLGRMEAYVTATLDAVLAALHRLADLPLRRDPQDVPRVGFQNGRALLVEHTDELFGPPSPGRDVRVMVTMPTEAADDPQLISELVAQGMNVMRINCSKDGPDHWRRMIDHVRRAESESGKTCRIHMDLAGPNPRTAHVDKPFRLIVGDRVVITGDNVSPRPPVRNEEGDLMEAAQIGCTLPEVLRDVKEGERFYYDDGGLGGDVIAADGQQFTVEITHARKGSVKIRSDKGMNLPDTDLDLPSLTAKDRQDLDFVVRHADMVGLSFVRDAQDVEQLIDELDARDAAQLGIVLKIETRRAFDELPRLLIAAMRSPPLGVMVARGDMGVEMGFDRMAEVQEEILWLCEAAHVPVIWATQVLESLAKKGLPSRAEVTDAAMSGRAECVMLNKGEHIVQTVRFLVDILQRMEAHQHKKLAMLRKLSISERL